MEMDDKQSEALIESVPGTQNVVSCECLTTCIAQDDRLSQGVKYRRKIVIIHNSKILGFYTAH